MTKLADRLDQYLAIQRDFGRDLSDSGSQLRPFVRFADAEGAEWISTDLFLRWRKQYGSASALTWSYRLSMVRSFAKWLQGVDPCTEVPPTGLISAKRQRPRPHIYSDHEVARIVVEAARLPSACGLRGWTCSTLFGLLAATGLRLGEAVGLDDEDVDLRAEVLAVRKPKHGRGRLVPISPSTAERLDAYRLARNRILRTRAKPFFRNEKGDRLSRNNAQYNFARVCQQIGIREPQPSRKHGHGPRLHDLRHSMAVKTMLDWYRTGRDPNREMYKLSTYLGHAHPNHTYWYMEAVPELLRLACERAEQPFRKGDCP